MKFKKSIACLKSFQQLVRLPLTFTNGGFTLIEILVAVLIIGILAAIALPQYQRAVLKSRFAALMPIAKSMADSNEAYYLEHGEYADNAEDLPVQGRMNYSDGTELSFGTTTSHAYVLATRDNDFPNKYIVYQKHSEQYPGEIHCEAESTNDLAKDVCKSFGATDDIGETLTSGYLTYVLFGTGNGTAPSGDNSGNDEPGDEPGDNPGTNTEPEEPVTPTMTAADRQTACENTSGCTATSHNDGTVTTKQCVTGTGNPRCTNTTYAVNGDVTNTTIDECNVSSGRAEYVEGRGCRPTNIGNCNDDGKCDTYYQITYDETGENIIETRGGRMIGTGNNKRVFQAFINSAPDENGNYINKWVECNRASYYIVGDNLCNGGTVYVTTRTFNSSGTQITTNSTCSFNLDQGESYEDCSPL